MSILHSKLRRREFLTGAASVVGVGALGIAPSLVNGQIAVSTGPQLFFWNGVAFVPASRVGAIAVNGDSVEVQISGFGTSPHITSVDVQMPGGIFHAFTPQPSGLQTTKFSVPINTPLGLTLSVNSSASAKRFALVPNSMRGLRLVLGTYLLLDGGVSAASLQLTSSPTAPVVYSDGQVFSVPYALIAVSQ